MRAGAKPVRYDSLVRQVRLQNVVGVGLANANVTRPLALLMKLHTTDIVHKQVT